MKNTDLLIRHDLHIMYCFTPSQQKKKKQKRLNVYRTIILEGPKLRMPLQIFPLMSSIHLRQETKYSI
jgi:hypothetical protein